MTIRWKFILLGTAVVLTIAGFGLIKSQPTTSALTIQSTTAADMAKAQRESGPYVIQSQGQVVAGILPHHTLVAPLMKAFFDGLPSSAPGRVVVLGPDHQDRGAGRLCTTTRDWNGVTGPVVTDSSFVGDLVAAGVAVVDDQLLQTEHGVNAVIPFVHQRWPGTKVVAMTMKSGTSPEERDRLVKYLADHLGAHDLVLASVDFSHYHPLAQAQQEDTISLDAVARLDADQALTIPVDGPGPIAVVLGFARQRHAQEQRLRHLNSAEYLGQPGLDSTTSYLFSYFVKS